MASTEYWIQSDGVPIPALKGPRWVRSIPEGKCVVPRGVRTTALDQLSLPREACTLGQQSTVRRATLGWRLRVEWKPPPKEKKPGQDLQREGSQVFQEKRKAWRSQGGVRPGKCWSSSSSSPGRSQVGKSFKEKADKSSKEEESPQMRQVKPLTF